VEEAKKNMEAFISERLEVFRSNLETDPDVAYLHAVKLFTH
jgi:hypothetical protein